jgi:hypothetical protein
VTSTRGTLLARVPHAAPDPRRGSVTAWAPTALVGAITAVGLALPLPMYGDAVSGDEMSTFFIATDRSLGSALRLLWGDSVDLNPALYFVVAWLSQT